MNSKKIAAIVAMLMLAAIFTPSALAVSNSKHAKLNEGSMVNDKIIIVSGPITKTWENNGSNFTEDYYLIRKQNDPAVFPPLGVHLLKKENSRPRTLMGMLEGTGLPFYANYMTHDETSLTLTEYLANNQDYYIVGIDARETNIAYDPAADYNFMAQLDLPQHTTDVETAIQFAQEKTGIENYELTGHSLGLYIAADYAAKHHCDRHFKKVTGIDMPGPLDPLTESELIQKEYDAYNASVQALASGQTVNFEMLGFGQMMYMAQIDPLGDSGMPNPFAPGTNYTNIEAVAGALLYTGTLPGNEIFIQGFLAGDIASGPYYTPLGTMFEAGTQGTIYPVAIDRDVSGIYVSAIGSYQIRWQDIEVPFEWWNMEVGMGNRPQAVSLMQKAGNTNAHFHLMQGYGHADAVYATNAQQNLWQNMYE